MKKLLSAIACSIALSAALCGNHETTSQNMSESGTESESSYFHPYDIGSGEVRDTSFALSRTILEDPMAFMKAITDVQMIGRKWTETYNYPEKLLYGDSIISEICCRIVRANKKHPVFIVEEINIGEILYYHFSIQNNEDSSYITYSLIGETVKESPNHITDTLLSLMDKWNVGDMFLLGGEDKVPYIEIEIEEVGIVHYGRPTGNFQSGCVTRLACDNDSVYVDMVKLYLWPFRFYDKIRKRGKIINSH